MALKNDLRKKLFSSYGGQVFFYKIRRVREKLCLARYSDYEYVQKIAKERFGREKDLADPKTFTEKLQWLKLFYRDEKMPICSDKYRVREYLKECGLEHLGNEILGVYDDARKIDFDKLPEKFVAKANHGSGWNLICKDKASLDRKGCVKLMNEWLKLNLYVFGREWNYKEIKPRIVVEKFLDHEPLNDYKFMCFNGEPLYMQLNNDYKGTHYVDFYDLDGWKHLPFSYGSYRISDRVIEKPPMYDKMFELARQLSKPFPFVRVDFYNYDDVVILGELTFFPGGGLWPLNPVETGYDETLGEKLRLPAPNHNLELLAKLKEKAEKK